MVDVPARSRTVFGDSILLQLQGLDPRHDVLGKFTRRYIVVCFRSLSYKDGNHSHRKLAEEKLANVQGTHTISRQLILRCCYIAIEIWIIKAVDIVSLNDNTDCRRSVERRRRR